MPMRSLQPVTLQMRCNRGCSGAACRHRLIHGIGCGAFKHRPAGSRRQCRPGQRARRVLVSGNRNDAIATDAPHRRFDSDEHGLIRRAQIDPEVSVPTFAAQKLAAVPMPELDPPVRRAGRPSFVPSRGSRRGSYGLNP